MIGMLNHKDLAYDLVSPKTFHIGHVIETRTFFAYSRIFIRKCRLR